MGESLLFLLFIYFLLGFGLKQGYVRYFMSIQEILTELSRVFPAAWRALDLLFWVNIPYSFQRYN